MSRTRKASQLWTRWSAVLFVVLACVYSEVVAADGPAAGAAATDHPFVMTLSRHPQLFLDDHLIGATINLKREAMQPETPSRNLHIEPEYPWEARRISYPVVLLDPDGSKWRMYYTAFADPTVRRDAVMCYAESDDGVHWRKPMLDIYPFGDSPVSNIVLGWDDEEPQFTHVIRMSDTSGKPFKALCHGRTGLVVTQSTDGVHWDPHRLISDTKCDTIPSVVWHAPSQTYFAYTRAQAWHPEPPSYFRMTGVLQSANFINWTPKFAINLMTEEAGWPVTQIHDLQAYAYGDVLLASVTTITLDPPMGHIDKANRRWSTQMATSRDGWHWRPVLDRQKLPFWTRSLVVRDDVMYLYGAEFDLWMLPADRFVAMVQQDPESVGILDTPPVRFDGSDLIVNADCDPAQLQVELIDEKGPVVQYQSKPVPGFERGRSRLVRHDPLRYRVVWEAEGRTRRIADAADHQPFVLRFILKRGKLFAFQLSGSADAGGRQE